MFYSKYTFSKAFRWFAKRLFDIHLITREDSDTSYILDYSRNWINKCIDAQHINSIEDFMKSTIGYMHLTLTQREETDKQPSISLDGNTYTILEGIYRGVSFGENVSFDGKPLQRTFL